MNHTEAARLRLTSHHLTDQTYATVLDAVSGLGALQAQDYSGGLWSIGCRVQGATLADVTTAIEERQIIRSWPMRGTLHFLPAADARWMMHLMGPRSIAKVAARWRTLSLDDAIFEAACIVVMKTLQAGPVRRGALLKALEDAGIATAEQRGYHLLWRAALECRICLGPMDGKQPTYVLFDQWITQHNTPSHSEALAIMAHRYFTSHGPTTLKDFAGWTGLTMADARLGLAAVQHDLEKYDYQGTTFWYGAPPKKPSSVSSYHLLAGFDELVLGYKDRSLLGNPEYMQRVVPGNNGVFLPTIIKDGRVLGTWQKTLTKSQVRINLVPFTPLSKVDLAGITRAADAYARFLGVAQAVI